MRIHGLGDKVVADIIMKYPPRRPGGWLEGARVKSAVYLLADGTLSVLRNAPCVALGC